MPKRPAVGDHGQGHPVATAMPSRRLRILSLLAVLPATCLVAELGLRLFDLGPPPRPAVTGTAVRPVADPVLRFAPQPGAERIVAYPAHGDAPARRVVQRINAQGFRGPEVEVPKPEGVRRVLCVGDSHTFGEGVEDGDTWPRILEGLLRAAHGAGIEVVNAGVAGYDTVQEARWLELLLARVEPDLVLVQFFVNDANRRDAATEADDAGWLLASAHPRSRGPLARIRPYSRLVDAVLETVFRRGYFDHWSAGNARHLTADEAGWARWSDAIARIDRRCAEAGTPWAVVLYPFMHAPGGEYASAAAHRRVTAHLAAVGIAHHDAEPAFHGRDPVALRVHPGDLHAGAAANRIFAESVAEWLADGGAFADALADPR